MWLHVRVIEARDLPSMDPSGLADPYCRMYLNDNKKELAKTRTIKETLTPVWNESFSFKVRDTLPGTTLHITLYDEDLLDSSKISQLDFPYQQLPIGKVIDQWLDLQPSKSGRAGGRLHIIFHVTAGNEAAFVETKAPAPPKQSVVAPPTPVSAPIDPKIPQSPYSEFDLSIVFFVKDELHPETDGQFVASILQRVTKDKQFKSVNLLPINSKVADCDAVYEKVPKGPKSIVVLILSNDTTKYLKLLQTAINNTNFVIPDLDGVRLDGQKIVPELELGAPLTNPIDFAPLAKKWAPKISIGKDADLFIVNYLYARGITKIGKGIGSVVRLSTPSVESIPAREQVKFIVDIVNHIVGTFK
jgi:hypothetical protein